MQCGRHVCSGAYLTNVQVMYTSAPIHIIDCIEFLQIIYADTVRSYLHMK